MKFIGHLDIMRYFQKAIRRAGIDIAYSEGFSPHQIMSFAAPLGVGLESEGEYFDIEVNTTKSSKESIDLLNEQMVHGMEITEYKLLREDAKKAMSVVSAADYKVILKNSREESKEVWQERIRNFFDEKDEVLITKQTKKSERIINLKEFVYDFSVEKEKESICFFLKVSTGSVDNIKPELVLEALFCACNLEIKESDLQVVRLEVYMDQLDRTKEENQITSMDKIIQNLIPLGSAGDDIES